MPPRDDRRSEHEPDDAPGLVTRPEDATADIRGLPSDLVDELEADPGRPGDPDDPAGQNSPVGESTGAGMEDLTTDHGDPGRKRFREMRM